ncbi:MAG: HIRAN domain-containing protein [Actinomycetota bacterium]|nr:HIRAN domain-containing protein [Actinomycetota bacterium]
MAGRAIRKRRNAAEMAGTRGADELGPYLLLPPGNKREAVGESNYQEALERISGGRTREGANLKVIARLVPDLDNPYDSNAVSVRVAGQVVAYLPRSEAKQVHAKLTKLREGVGCDIACRGLIVGGWKRGFLGRDQGHFGIKIDFADL